MSDYGLSDMILQHKASVIDKYKFLTECNPSSHEPVELNSYYTEPVIVQRSKHYYRRSSKRLSNDKNHSINIKELFSPNRDGNTPKTVILSGDSGRGKSFLLQKIMLDWASGKLYSENFDAVFLLKFEGLESISDVMNLNVLLSLNCSLKPDQISQILQLKPEKVLILIDGAYEYVFNLDSYSSIRHSLSEYSLRELLPPESFMIVTTRSRPDDEVMISLLNDEGPQRLTEIMGFSERGVQEYFQKFFQDEQLFMKTYERVKRNETLLTFCSVPLLCWMVCCCLKKHFKDDDHEMAELKTTTSIYVHFLSTLLEDHDQSQSVFRILGQLADKGMENEQVVFDENRLAMTGLDLDTCVFLLKESYKEKHRQKSQFRFMHFSFQEFFSVLFYLSQESTRNLRMLIRQLHYFRTRSSVLLFLCGLSNVKLRHLLYEQSVFTKETWTYIVASEMDWIIRHLIHEDELFAFYCLYELQDEEFTRRVLLHWGAVDLSHVPLKSTDCWVLLYCLQLSPHIRDLNLMYCELTPDKLKILQPVLHTCETLRLSVEHLSDVGDLIQTLDEANIWRQIKVEEDEDRAEGPRWSLDLSVTSKEYLVSLSSSETNPSFPAVLHISLTCPQSQISRINWTLFSQTLSKAGKLAEDSSSDESVRLLLSSFHSVDLKTLDLKLVSLNESWASGIISLVQTCTSLQQLSVRVTGLLSEGGLKILNESLMDPHCTVSIEGMKCSKPTDQCREQDWHHSCNKKVKIHFKPKALEELKEKCSKPTDQSTEEHWSHSCDEKMEGLFTPEELEQLEELKVSESEACDVHPHPLPVCQSCVHVADSDQWVQVEPSVCRDEGGSEFRISTPAGRFECSRTTMRWVCAGDVNLQYRAVDGGFLNVELERLQYERIGPVIDVTVISGKLEEAHLPHYICLAESDPSLSDAVKLLSVEEGGISLQSVELTRFHAKIFQPSFSPTTVVKEKDIRVEQHVDLLIFMIVEDPIILHVYFLPRSDTFSKDRIKRDEKKNNPYGIEIEHPWPDGTIQMNTPHILSVNGADVVPEEGISFLCNVYPNFFVIRQCVIGDVKMNLIRQHDKMSVWKTTIFKEKLVKKQIVKRALKRKRDNADLFNDHWPKLICRIKNVLPVADELFHQKIISGEQYSVIRQQFSTPQDRMREICSIIQTPNQAAKFIWIVQQKDPFALEDLEEDPSSESFL